MDDKKKMILWLIENNVFVFFEHDNDYGCDVDLNCYECDVQVECQKVFSGAPEFSVEYFLEFIKEYPEYDI